MIFTKLIVQLTPCSNKPSLSYTVTTHKDGLMITMPASPKTPQPVQCHEVEQILKQAVDMFVWENITWQVFTQFGTKTIPIYEFSYSYTDLVTLYKQWVEQQMAIDECYEDDSCRFSLAMWVVEEMLKYHIMNMMKSVQQVKLIEELKDKDCPVLMTPLTLETSACFDKCKHYISVEAVTKLQRTVSETGDRTVSCPLCRQEHRDSEITVLR